MGMPFEGRGIDGYDRVQKKFVSSWMDNMGTMIMHSEGKLGGTPKALTLVAEYVDPMTGKPTTAKMVTTILDDDRHKFEYFAPGPDGKYVLAMEMIYTTVFLM